LKRNGRATRPRRSGSWLGLIRRNRPEARPASGPEPARGRGWAAGAQTSVGYLLLLTLVLAVVTVAMLAHLYVRFEGVRLGYETNRARATRTRLLLERRELRLELASLKSPDRVEAEARERLGMEIPDHRRIVPVGGKLEVLSVSGGAL
jgi:cell division protein FtsL